MLFFFPYIPSIITSVPSVNENMIWRYEEIGVLLKPSFDIDHSQLFDCKRLVKILKSLENQKQSAATEG